MSLFLPGTAAVEDPEEVASEPGFGEEDGADTADALDKRIQANKSGANDEEQKSGGGPGASDLYNLKDKLAGGGAEKGAEGAAAGGGVAETGSGGAAATGGVTTGSGGVAAGTGAAGAATGTGAAGAATVTGATGAAGAAASTGTAAGVVAGGGATVISGPAAPITGTAVAVVALASNKKSRKVLIATIISVVAAVGFFFALPLFVLFVAFIPILGSGGNTEAAEGLPQTPGENQYAKIGKTVEAKSLAKTAAESLHLENNQIPQTLSYAVNIQAKANIQNVGCTDEITLTTKEGGIETLTQPPITGCPTQMAAGQTFNFSFNYDLAADPKFQDAVVTNSFGIGAVASGVGATGNLDYTIPFRDVTVNVVNEDDEKYNVANNPQWPNNYVFTDCGGGQTCWDYLKQKSIQAGVNPAFVLAVWISESGASSTVGGHLSCPNGGVGLPHTVDEFKISVDCFLHGTSGDPYKGAANYPADQFARMIDDFCDPGTPEICYNPAEVAGGWKQFPTTLKSWYNNLVPPGSAGAMTINTGGSVTPSNFTLSVVATVTIGNAAASCYSFVGDWTAAERQSEEAAIAHISQAPALLSKICSKGSVTLTRVHGQAFNTTNCPGNINITEQGIGSLKQTAFTLAHESGHILQCLGDPTWKDFQNLAPYASEGYICSYPYEAVFGHSEGVSSEDYAEMIGIYVSWPNFRTSLCGVINMPTQYPLHYNFAKDKLFGGYQFTK
ncbi:MAG TPA: hypothetical protein VLE47_04225 [Candidatus Saccharimonadales bacterium]|nr:hypothetical protein [Candidatus Saccharimonadales bacterium]